MGWGGGFNSPDNILVSSSRTLIVNLMELLEWYLLNLYIDILMCQLLI